MNPANPLTQDDLRNTASLNFGLPGNLSAKTSFLQESQKGTSLGENNSLGGRLEVSSLKWKDFNFSVSGECKFTNVVEAGSNTMVPQTAPGNGIFSQTYTYTMEGKPLDHLTLSGKGMYSNDPPGPAKANVTETYKTDPLKWLTSNGSYSLDFQQEQALGSESPDEVHTASANVEATPLSWLKLSTQPSMRLDILADYGKMVSENLHQNYRAALTPSFGSLSGDYTLDQYWTWDASTAGFPQNFNQQTETIDLAARKPLGRVTEEVTYKRVNQQQDNISAGTNTSSQSLNQTETDSTNWNTGSFLTLTFTHTYNQLDQSSPGQGNATNPLLPNGVNSFNGGFSGTLMNAETWSHSFTGRFTEQMTKELSIYEEGGYTHTVDVMQGGTVETYSPAAGFTWKIGSALNWTAGYQYNGSSGEVSTVIQKAQTTLTAALNPGTNLSLSWNWTRSDDPFVVNQQGNVSYAMNF